MKKAKKTKMNSLKKYVAVFGLTFICLSIGFIVGTNMAYPVAYNEGAKIGYTSALADVANLLQQKGITLDWKANADGSYLLTISTPDGQATQVTVAVNLLLEWRDKYGNLKNTERGTGYLTDWGKDWIEQELSGTNNATQSLLYVSDSNDATDPSGHPEWTALPSEITNKGLERALGAYASTGVGVWTVTKTKTATDTVSTQLWGLNAAAYADDANALVAADSTPAQKNMVVDDTLTETWTITVS